MAKMYVAARHQYFPRDVFHICNFHGMIHSHSCFQVKAYFVIPNFFFLNTGKIPIHLFADKNSF